jgi:hypothetical protein
MAATMPSSRIRKSEAARRSQIVARPGQNNRSAVPCLPRSLCADALVVDAVIIVARAARQIAFALRA